MKTCSKCHTEKPTTEFHKHCRMKDGLTSICKECAIAVNRAKYLANTEAVKAQATAWKAANRDRYRETSKIASRARYAANPEAALAYSAKWAAENREKYLATQVASKKAQRARNPELAREKQRNWSAANRHLVSAQERTRRLAERKSETLWDEELDIFATQEAHHLRLARNKATGITWNVDHVVPLRGKTVCGLHNAFNLAVIPASVNMSKKNRYWPEMPC